MAAMLPAVRMLPELLRAGACASGLWMHECRAERRAKFAVNCSGSRSDDATRSAGAPAHSVSARRTDSSRAAGNDAHHAERADSGSAAGRENSAVRCPSCRDVAGYSRAAEGTGQDAEGHDSRRHFQRAAEDGTQEPAPKEPPKEPAKPATPDDIFSEPPKNGTQGIGSQGTAEGASQDASDCARRRRPVRRASQAGHAAEVG